MTLLEQSPLSASSPSSGFFAADLRAGGTSKLAEVRGLACVQWRNPPPTIIRSVRSTAQVGALAHAGFARDGGPQEARVPELPHDALIVFDRPADVRARIGDREVRFIAGRHSAVYFCAGHPSHWVASRGSRAHVFHVYVPVQFRERILTERRHAPSSVALLGPRDPTVQIAEHFRAALVDGNALPSLSVESYAALIVDGWASARLGTLTSSLARWQLNRVVDLMHARLAEDIGLGEIAAAAKLSLSHFARSFRKATGVSPHRYLVQLRLEKTKALLRSTDSSIADIATEVGYPDPGYLARVFRRELGITPAAYRREHRDYTGGSGSASGSEQRALCGY